MKIEDLMPGNMFYSKQQTSYDYKYTRHNLYTIVKIAKKGSGYQIHLSISNIKDNEIRPYIISFTEFKRCLVPLKSNARVHITHCCVRHGCKYGDKDCPVENGYVDQQYDCEDCDNDKKDAIRELLEIGFKRTKYDNKLFVWNKYDFYIKEKNIYHAKDVLVHVIEYVQENGTCCCR